MGCNSCSSNKLGTPAGCRSNGSCQTGCGSQLDVYDWLSNVYYVDEAVRHSLVEVKFKGTRKGFYRNSHNLALEIGDKVVVEAHMGGHDVGLVSLVGPLIKVQMKKYRIKEDSKEIRKVYRVCSENDIEKWHEAKAREYVTMMKARTYAIEHGLQMKISDVEFQGDNTKATFYYTADGRVDFRELIKTLSRSFKIKIEMRQVGLRQEAGRLGGIGSCGRELCCSTWLTNFQSVPTTAARYQNLFLNPLKLSGQCGRLKCCLNYELDTYLEALEEFPKGEVSLMTGKGRARVVKTDILKRILYFVVQDDPTSKLLPVELDDVKEFIEAQKRGEKVIIDDIEEYTIDTEPAEKEPEISGDIMADDLDRFDKKNKPKKKKRRKPQGPDNRNRKPGQGSQPRGPRQENKGQEERKQGEPKAQNPRKQQSQKDKEGHTEKRAQRPQGNNQRNRPKPNQESQTPRNEGNAPTGEPTKKTPRNKGPRNPHDGDKPRPNRNRNNRNRNNRKNGDSGTNNDQNPKGDS